MSVREEDRQKNCPSRGLGLAAAAIGVGVGAALYYFFSKSPEQPASEGSTSSNWSSEEAQALSQDMSNSDSSDTTECDEDSGEMSTENNTSDSSSSDTEESSSHEDLTANTTSDSLSTSFSDSSSQSEGNESFMFSSSSTDDSIEILSDLQLVNFSPDGYTRSTNDSTSNRHETLHTPHRQNGSNERNGANAPRTNDIRLSRLLAPSVDSDIDTRDWDVTNSLLGLPDANDPYLSASTMITIYENIISEYSQYISGRNSRERVRTVEDCSICFEPMQRDQQLVALSCTHYFHAACIRPWLDEQNTCPNCRKYATA